MLKKSNRPKLVQSRIYTGSGKRKKRDNPEQRLQFAVARFLTWAVKPPFWWTAIGHGGGGGLRGMFLKAMGVKPGVADLLVMGPQSPLNHNPVVVWIELKSEDGDQSGAQIDFEADQQACHAHYYIARSVDEVEGFLKGVGIPLHATTGRAG